MEMRIDKGWRDQIPAGIDLGPGGTLQFGLDRRDRLAADADIGNPAIRQRAATNDKVEIHLSSSRLKNHFAIVSQKTAWGYGIERVGRERAAQIEPTLVEPPEFAVYVAEEGVAEPVATARALLTDAERHEQISDNRSWTGRIRGDGRGGRRTCACPL